MRKIRVLLCLFLFVLLGKTVHAAHYSVLFNDQRFYKFRYIKYKNKETIKDFVGTLDLDIKRLVVECFNACRADAKAFASWEKAPCGKQKKNALKKLLKRTRKFKKCVDALTSEQVFDIYKNDKKTGEEYIKLGGISGKLHYWITKLEKEDSQDCGQKIQEEKTDEEPVEATNIEKELLDKSGDEIMNASEIEQDLVKQGLLDPVNDNNVDL